MPGDSEPVEVLWEDDWLIAVNKPAHLVCLLHEAEVRAPSA